MVPISLAAALALMYFYISTFRSMCAVPNMAVFCNSLTSWFIIIIIIIIIPIIINQGQIKRRPSGELPQDAKLQVTLTHQWNNRKYGARKLKFLHAKQCL
jgi:hypothetical protein